MQDDLVRQYVDLESRHWWWRARARIVAEAVERFLVRDAGRCVICIGSGPGYTQAAVAQRADRTIGIEPNEVLRQHAGAVLGLDVRPGSLPGDLPSELPLADLVLLLDVLEHIEDDTAACREAASLLKPGGRLVVTVPSCPWLWGPWDELNEHRRRYTRRGLATVLTRAEIGIEQLSHFNTLLFPLMVCRRLQDRLSRGGLAGSTVPPERLNRFLEFVFGAERFWLRWASLPWGGSLLCISKPRGVGA